MVDSLTKKEGTGRGGEGKRGEGREGEGRRGEARGGEGKERIFHFLLVLFLELVPLKCEMQEKGQDVYRPFKLSA
jgi:hypothetical protein